MYARNIHTCIRHFFHIIPYITRIYTITPASDFFSPQDKQSISEAHKQWKGKETARASLPFHSLCRLQVPEVFPWYQYEKRGKE